MLTLTTSLLLVGQVVAGITGNIVVRREDEVEKQMRRYVDTVVEPIERRQSAGMSGLNVTDWDASTTAACATSLMALNGVATNPSGLAVCYNLPFLDNSTGVFEADLRLYMISAPTGAFANIPSQDVQVGLQYNGATVSTVNASSLKRSEERTSLISWPRDEHVRRQMTTPMLIQSYAFVGQINKPLLATPMGTAALQKVLVPVVTLTGTDSTGAKVNTSLTSDQATFVSGVFANVVTPTKSQLQPPIQTLVVASGTPFVVPGLQILIAPIGAVITGIWTIAFLTTVGYGTIGRMQFREQFRRRTAMANRGNQARI